MQNLSTLFAFILLLLLITGCSTLRPSKVWESGRVAGAAFYEEVPFTEQIGLAFVEVHIGGKARRFLFDTGAPNLISKELAAELKLKPHFSRPVTDSQQRRQKLDYVRLDTLRIGKLRFERTAAVVADLRAVPLFECLEIDGFIGANLMKLATWQIDFTRHQLTIADDISRLSLDSAYLVPFTTSAQGSPFFTINIDGRSVKIELDYGSTGSITLQQKSVTGHRKWEPILHSYGSASISLYGRSQDTVRYAIFPDVRIGQLSLGEQVVKVRQGGSNLLGTDILRRHLVSIDWKNRRFYLRPLEPLQMNWRSFGLSLRTDGDRLVVDMLYDPSPARTAGLRLEDEILTLNGLPASDLLEDSDCRLRQLLGNADKLEMEYLQNGVRKQLVLEKAPLIE